MRNRLRVIKVEGGTAAGRRDSHGGNFRARTVDAGTFRFLLCEVGFLFGQSLRFFFFLLYTFDNLVDNRQPLGLWHLGKRLQTVLEMDSFGVHHQFVQDGREFRDPVVILIFLLDNGERSAEVRLRLDVITLLEVQVA